MFCKVLSKEVRVTLLELKYAFERTVIEDEYKLSVEDAETVLCNNLVIDLAVKDLGVELTYINKDNISHANISKTNILIDDVNETINISDFTYENEINGFGYIVAAIEYVLNIESYNHKVSDDSQKHTSATPLNILNDKDLKPSLWDSFQHKVLK